jgi:hypothetical protein
MFNSVEGRVYPKKKMKKPYESPLETEEERTKKYRQMQILAKDIRDIDDMMNAENKTDNQQIIMNSK